MQILDFFQKFGLPKGVIHVSPGLFFIRSTYLFLNLNNIIWIEGNPFFYQNGLNTLQNSSEKLFNHCIGPNNVGLNLSINNGENVFHEIQSSSLKNLLESNSLNITDYDYVYIGKQVCKLNLDYFDLENFKYVILESSINIENDLNYDSKKVKSYMKSKRFKLIGENIQNNIALLFFVKKRDYIRK